MNSEKENGFDKTVMVNTRVKVLSEEKFHCFLTDRQHPLELDEIEGKDPHTLMDNSTKKNSYYEKVAEQHLAKNIENAESFWIMSVVGFSDEETLDKFISEGQIEKLNEASN